MFGGIRTVTRLPSLQVDATALPNHTYIGASLGITPSIVIVPPPHSVDVRGDIAAIENRPSEAPGRGGNVVVGAVEAVVAVVVGVVVRGGCVVPVVGEVVAVGVLGAVVAGAAVVAVEPPDPPPEPPPEPPEPPLDPPPEPPPEPAPERGSVVAVDLPDPLPHPPPDGGDDDGLLG
ncbi:MAG: hypothetical protein JWL72_2162, partial [Ilumatobacteraceae bacterium]|nr:hypothetical protein [Ilumatobacteraceae bacterium]